MKRLFLRREKLNLAAKLTIKQWGRENLCQLDGQNPKLNLITSNERQQMAASSLIFKKSQTCSKWKVLLSICFISYAILCSFFSVYFVNIQVVPPFPFPPTFNCCHLGRCRLWRAFLSLSLLSLFSQMCCMSQHKKCAQSSRLNWGVLKSLWSSFLSSNLNLMIFRYSWHFFKLQMWTTESSPVLWIEEKLSYLGNENRPSEHFSNHFRFAN